ncbi:MAG: uL15 family ribosomal protein [Candidatus Yanofskybacteria bacterium]|nr:uL15 family ribosomal protein [Candidatus Yanofskybacteria bacterium]
MQLHELKKSNKPKERKRVGRGGKRGTFSGRGSKGQMARGARLGADFRGGNAPIWKLFPKKRGSNKKVEIKHRSFKLRQNKPDIVSLAKINNAFKEGDLVSPETLNEKKVTRTKTEKIKLLGGGELGKKLIFSGIIFSGQAREKVLKSGSEIK